MNDIEEPLHPESESEKPKAKNADETFRLGGRTPLKTILILAVGPFISQIVSACYGVVASMWVARALGDLGMAAISLFTNLDNIGRAFGFFMNCSASQKISSLFGENKGDEAGQVISDLVRCSMLSGMFIPAVMLPCAKPLGRWFGADDQTNQMGFDYLVPLLGCSVFSVLYLMICGCLQAEGRTMLVSATQISSFVMNMAIFCPLFLLVFKLGTPGAALATICSEGIPTIVLFILYYRGKFGVKPKLNQLFKKFSPHTFPALNVGVSQLFANISRSLPAILLRKFMGMACENSNGAWSFNDAMAGFNAVIRIYGITDSVRLAISMALLPTASFANSSHRFKRLIHLILHACWMNLVWGTTTCIVTAFAPQYVAMMISKSENFIRCAAPMLQISNWEAPFAWVRFLCQTILQALGHGTLATCYSVGATFVASVAAYCILYYTDTDNVPRLMYNSLISSTVGLVVGLIIIINPLRKVYLQAKGQIGTKLPDEKDNDREIEENNTIADHSSSEGHKSDSEELQEI